jgi:hypothetical protein
MLYTTLFSRVKSTINKPPRVIFILPVTPADSSNSSNFPYLSIKSIKSSCVPFHDPLCFMVMMMMVMMMMVVMMMIKMIHDDTDKIMITIMMIVRAQCHNQHHRLTFYNTLMKSITRLDEIVDADDDNEFDDDDNNVLTVG